METGLRLLLVTFYLCQTRTFGEVTIPLWYEAAGGQLGIGDEWGDYSDAVVMCTDVGAEIYKYNAADDDILRAHMQPNYWHNIFSAEADTGVCTALSTNTGGTMYVSDEMGCVRHPRFICFKPTIVTIPVWHKAAGGQLGIASEWGNYFGAVVMCTNVGAEIYKYNTDDDDILRAEMKPNYWHNIFSAEADTDVCTALATNEEGTMYVSDEMGCISHPRVICFKPTIDCTPSVLSRYTSDGYTFQQIIWTPGEDHETHVYGRPDGNTSCQKNVNQDYADLYGCTSTDQDGFCSRGCGVGTIGITYSDCDGATPDFTCYRLCCCQPCTPGAGSGIRPVILCRDVPTPDEYCLP